MSHSIIFDDGRPARQPVMPTRQLDAIEMRVLGSLLEKQQTTPENYPLTLNALVSACNQKSNRDPVMELPERDVDGALIRLQDEKLAWRIIGGRATRWDHNLDKSLMLDPASKAILTLLLLRGAQTAGEMRGRSDRLYTFDSVSDVEDLLKHLASRTEPLVRELDRKHGQKETRWIHLLGEVNVSEQAVIASEAASAGHEPMSVRVLRLEEQVALLTTELHALKEKLGE